MSFGYYCLRICFHFTLNTTTEIFKKKKLLHKIIIKNKSHRGIEYNTVTFCNIIKYALGDEFKPRSYKHQATTQQHRLRHPIVFSTIGLNQLEMESFGCLWLCRLMPVSGRRLEGIFMSASLSVHNNKSI